MTLFRPAVAGLESGLIARRPEERLRKILERHRRALGPTQWRHLTTHSMQVSELAVRLGRVLAMEPADLERLLMAGRLHDLGKLLIPEEVLAKPAKLSADERRLVDRHAEDGATMGLLLGIDQRTAQFIRYHHAWYDAIDRQARRQEGAVPLGARILAVADAFVTMTSQRSYQPARTRREALEELQRCSGTQFDPIVVGAATDEAEPCLAEANATAPGD